MGAVNLELFENLVLALILDVLCLGTAIILYLSVLVLSKYDYLSLKFIAYPFGSSSSLSLLQ